MRAALVLLALAGCAELGVITDGSSISMGRPSGGLLVDGSRLPDHGEGFTTRDTWRTRGNRYGTDEMLDLITGVGRRMARQFTGARLVVADLSTAGGGAARKWHRSHQNGRDVDLVYYMRDADGKPLEADAMRVFDRTGKAVDGSGITVDVPRTWLLVRELTLATEATVQWVFIYEPIAQKLLEHAAAVGELVDMIARVRLALKQPGDSAPHNDHMHVRVYCSPRDRAYGCVDVGPTELLALRAAELEHADQASAIVAALGQGAVQATTAAAAPRQARAVMDARSVIAMPREIGALGPLLRARSFYLRR